MSSICCCNKTYYTYIHNPVCVLLRGNSTTGISQRIFLTIDHELKYKEGNNCPSSVNQLVHNHDKVRNKCYTTTWTLGGKNPSV